MSLAIDVTKKEWIAALRSGDYKQDLGFAGMLTRYSRETYCCLGVACAIAPDVVLALKTHREDGPPAFSVYQKEGHTQSASLGPFRPEWMSREQEMACMYANDTLNMTFDEIADWWEKTDGAYFQREGAYIPQVNIAGLQDLNQGAEND